MSARFSIYCHERDQNQTNYSPIRLRSQSHALAKNKIKTKVIAR